MIPKKLAYYLSRITLLDEVLGFIYWAFAIYGIFLIAGHIKNQIATISVILIYIVTVTFFYIFLLKRLKKYFRRTPE
jgi:hypothetical protein